MKPKQISLPVVGNLPHLEEAQPCRQPRHRIELGATFQVLPALNAELLT